jgi:hypothetical protein
MAKKISTTIYVTEEQNRLLKELHKKTKVPVAEYIRMGIDMVLEKNRLKINGQLSFDDLLEDDDQVKKPD